MSAYDAHLYNQPNVGSVGMSGNSQPGGFGAGGGRYGAGTSGGSFPGSDPRYSGGDSRYGAGTSGGSFPGSDPRYSGGDSRYGAGTSGGSFPSASGNDPRYDPARAAAMRAFSGSGGGYQPTGSNAVGSNPGDQTMTQDQLDVIRGVSRQENCKHVLYVQRNKQTNELDLPSQFAWMESIEHDNDFALVDIADLDPRTFPSWLDLTPLLVVRRRDGQYIWKGEQAIRYLTKMSKSSVLGTPAFDDSSSLGKYMPSTWRDPRYDPRNGKLGDGAVAIDRVKAMREKQDQLRASRLKRPAGRPGQEPPPLPAINAKTPLSDDMLFAMGKHPSQIERRNQEFERQKYRRLQENPGRAIQSGW